MVWPMRVRRRARKHAFEQALDEVQFDPDGVPLLDEPRAFNPGAARAVGSLGDIAVATGYVAQASLQRAYGVDDEVERPLVRPGEAARKLKAMLESGELSSRELRRLRREFAAEHHPDRVGPVLRGEAVTAMSEVNAAIDRALKRARRP